MRLHHIALPILLAPAAAGCAATGAPLSGEESEYPSARFGGRFMHDWGILDVDDIEDELGEDIDEGYGFRSVRLELQGDASEHVGYKAQLEFSSGKGKFLDTWASYSGLELGKLKLGFFREPFSLQGLTSLKYNVMLERSASVEAFGPGRNTGVTLSNGYLDDRGTWTIGAFRAADDLGSKTGDDLILAGRCTWLPVFTDEGSELLHLGIAVRHRDTGDDTERYRARPGTDLVDRLIDTSDVDVDNSVRAGLELAWVHGPFAIQGEAMGASLDIDGEPDSELLGYYVQADYFLTGEHRAYSHAKGSFTRVEPLAPTGRGGRGAWQLAARWDRTDLDDESVRGGEQKAVTVGLNWIARQGVRLSWNYIHPYEDTIDESGDLFVIRMQIVF